MGREARLPFGIHRARELDAEALGLDGDADLIEKLERLMRDCAETGVHVWLWSDTVAGASRRLTPRMMREVGWRVAGRMSSDDSHSLLRDGQASDLRERQLVILVYSSVYDLPDSLTRWRERS